MTTFMQQNRTLFFAIIGLSILAVIGMFIGRSLVPAISTAGQVSIQVVVNPSLEAWARQAAQDYTQNNPNTRVEIIKVDTLIPTAAFNNPQTVPAAWLAEASFVVDLARNEGLQFADDSQSVASTTLAWGAYNDKLTQFNEDYGTLTWENLNAKATNPAVNNGLKLVIASPKTSAEGLAALISATAANQGKTSLSANDVSAATPWLNEALGNGNLPPTSLPGETFASVQGRTLGDAGLLAMASWRRAKLDQRTNDFTLTPLDPNITLDFPFAIWNGNQITADQQAAARAFRDFLLTSAQQQALGTFFFEPALSSSSGVQADGAAVQRLLDWTNRNLR
jgi:ABC-type Fe3+ transport system substrate-binding protein